MKTWYICSNGNTHEFFSWKDASQAWEIVKSEAPGDAVLLRGTTLIERA